MAGGQSDRRSWIRRGGIIAALIAVLLLLLYFCQPRPIPSVTTLHPDDHAATLALGDAVVTGFSGLTRPADAARAPADGTFIDVNGPAARIFDPRRPGRAWAGQYWAAPRTRDIPAAAVGQVFGIAIDDDAYANIYLAATALYGLNIVVPGRGRERFAQRVKTGQAGAEWMAGQFGPGGGPGSIWKIDGRSGAIGLFAQVSLGTEPIGSASLGTIAYDRVHRQLFVSDLATGDIHRLDLNGRDLGAYDHGVTGRTLARLPPVPQDGRARVDIHDAGFRPSDPSTWGFARAARRVFGLAVNPADHRLYYAVADGQIWSVGLDQYGGFANDPRLEVDIPDGANAAPVSDIVFARDGAMIAAQRGVIGTQYDYTPLARGAVAHVWRFWPAKPFDPAQPRHFYQSAEEYAVGYAGDSRNSAGGVALGYGYKDDGTIDLDGCEDAIFFTGDMLRDFRQTPQGIVPGGPLELYGLQISPKQPVRGFNVPPQVSYFVNYTDSMGSANRSGTVGDIAVYRIDCQDPGCKIPAADRRAAVVTPPAPQQVATASPPGGAAPPAGPPGNPPPGNPPNNPPPGTPPGCSPGMPGCGTPCIPGTPGCTLPCTPGTPGCTLPCTPGTPGCCSGDGCAPKNKVCKVDAQAVCDTNTGTWNYQLSTTDSAGIGIDMVTVHSATSGVSVSNGPDISLAPPPAAILLSGATPGQTVHINVCAFKNSDRLTGQPYDCCHVMLKVKVPAGLCTAGGHP